MRTKTLVLASLLGLAALGAARLVAFERTRAAAAPPAEDAERAGGVLAILSARPFVAERGWPHDWRRERPNVDAGWLVVLEVDRDLVRPRQVAEPVLYAGATTAERVNHGHAGGRVVAIVPSARGADGRPALDLAATELWFGTPELPERVDAATCARERAEALAAGVRPFSSEHVGRALARGGALLELGRREDLDALAGALVLEHSPEERDLAEGLMLPPVR